jgi:RNase P subunit RPR2
MQRLACDKCDKALKSGEVFVSVSRTAPWQTRELCAECGAEILAMLDELAGRHARE